MQKSYQHEEFYKKFRIILILVLFFGFCSPQTENNNGIDDNNENTVNITINSEGTENNLEIATWNLKNFPLASNTEEKLISIIPQLDIDIIAVQEIEDKDSFDGMVQKLEDYDGLLSTHIYSNGQYQKLGLIYKRSMISIKSSELLFTNDSYAFPRPPLLIKIDAIKGNRKFDFYLIIIHLKAFSEEENVERRRAAALKLKNYMDEKIEDSSTQEKDYIIVGDWNDLIEDEATDNAFQIFIDDEDYKFLTFDLIGNSNNASYPSRNEIIDHILISRDCFFEWTNGSVKTIRLDDQISSYSLTISDHRPVMAIFPVF